MKLYDFFLMLASLFVGLCCITGLVMLITYWRIVADLLRAIFLNHFDIWSSALVVTILIGFAFSTWASRRIHRSGRA